METFSGYGTSASAGHDTSPKNFENHLSARELPLLYVDLLKFLSFVFLFPFSFSYAARTQKNCFPGIT